jgi:hypothetical protein
VIAKNDIVRRARAVALVALLALLAGCATGGGRLQRAGGAEIFDLAFDTQLDWARLRVPRQERWTIDGESLNQLLITSRVKAGEHVFLGRRERRSRPDGPWFRPGMRPDEVRDVLLDAVRVNGWSRVEATDLRPQDFGGTPGLRFELQLTSPTGLRYRGMVAAAERERRLTTLVWIAAEEHYYARDKAAVAHLFDTLRFVD